MMEKSMPHAAPNDSGKIWSKDFILICTANFFIFLGFQMTLPTIPLFIEELGGNDRLIGLVVGIFTFAALILRPIAGHALESKGRALVYLTGLAIFVLIRRILCLCTEHYFFIYHEDYSRSRLGVLYYCIRNDCN